MVYPCGLNKDLIFRNSFESRQWSQMYTYCKQFQEFKHYKELSVPKFTANLYCLSIFQSFKKGVFHQWSGLYPPPPLNGRTTSGGTFFAASNTSMINLEYRRKIAIYDGQTFGWIVVALGNKISTIMYVYTTIQPKVTHKQANCHACHRQILNLVYTLGG